MQIGFTNKKCPKCGGNIFVGRECYFQGNLFTWFEEESCLQCGYISYESESPQLKIAVTTTATQREPLPV